MTMRCNVTSNSVLRFVKSVSVEPALALYIFTAFIKYPVFQALLYDKSCITRYNDPALCANASAIYKDKQLQGDEQRLMLFSSLCLLLPSIPTALLLGSLSDIWSAKIPILIPLLGVIAGDVNYIIQSTYFWMNPRWLLLSDIFSGFTGGYATLMGMMFSCSMKQTDSVHRGRRMAILEGSIGIGATLGFALSGIIRECLGYSMTFVLLLALRVLCFVYVVAIVHEIKPDKLQQQLSRSKHCLLIRLLRTTYHRLIDVYKVLTDSRPSRPILWLILTAFAVEILSFSGVNAIQYSFLRYKLNWNDKQYGWYKGLGYAFSTLAVLSIYPLMKSRGIKDMLLCSVALITKIISLVALAFVFIDWYAYLTTPLSALNRFIATSIRACASQTVDVVEQGKIFSMMSLIDGIVSLCGSTIFTSVYPQTLMISLPYLCFIIVSVLLLIPLVISVYLQTEHVNNIIINASHSTILNESHPNNSNNVA